MWQYLLGQIGNVDQTPVNFNMTSSTTASVEGAWAVKPLATRNEMLQFTVTVAKWYKTPPYIIFKRKTIPSEAFPKGVLA